jgi:hypothetical protein
MISDYRKRLQLLWGKWRFFAGETFNLAENNWKEVEATQEYIRQERHVYSNRPFGHDNSH